MAVTVKKVTLWRCEIPNKPGVLASVLEPLAAAGADLQVVMGYRYPDDKDSAAIEVYPVDGAKARKAARGAGLEPAETITCLLVEGDNKPGLGYAIAKAIAEAGIDMGFLVAQVVGKKYSALFGFETSKDATRAATLIKKATAPRVR
ncbi:MAG: hypothetical protein HY318_00985 [Armatimonadetes bacterium]|nr:hypothetical protein [Armatimonadota bacterium]